MKTYTFDVKLFACCRVEAESEAEARGRLSSVLWVAEETWTEGAPITVDLGTDGDPDLVEIDGEDV